VRLQLTRPRTLLLVTLAAALSARAHATGLEASSRLTMFLEPSTEKNNNGISVVHPQVDLNAVLGPSFKLAGGYEVDIVTGSTPRIFGPRTTTVDAVSSATKFSDTRHQGHLAIGYERPTSTLALGASYGQESDYKSFAITGTTSSDLMDHNFRLGLSYTHNFDSVCDANNSNIGDNPLSLRALTSSADCFNSAATDTTTRSLSIDTFQPSLSWTATPRLVLQLGSTIQILDGFQSNPYRSVLVGMQHRTPQERLPQFRQRYALYARLVYALPAVRGSVLVLGRIYDDSWAVQAGTGEILLNKYLSQYVILTARGRYHQQTGASFYRDGREYLLLGPNGRYWTGDRELSPMSNYLVGGKLSYLRRPEQERSSWFVEMELTVKYELLLYQLESADAPNADRKRAHIMQGAFSVRF
jgi:hypothetical protein